MSIRWKVGLVGAGYIVDAHIKALKALPNVEIAAVCDRSLDRAARSAELYGIAHVYPSIDKMLLSELDVVHILLPPDLHFETAKQVIESGRHAFLEKPMCIDAAQCQALVDLATEKNVKLGVNHNFLFLPSYERLRQQASDGTLGKFGQVCINWIAPLGLIQVGPFDNWILREPKNLFLEIGPHLVAFMMDLIGPMDFLRTSVYHPIDLPGGRRVYRRWHVHGRRGDVGVELNLSIAPDHPDRSITVHGHAATARCVYDRDLYSRDEPSGAGIVFDNFLATQSVIFQVFQNSIFNLSKAIVNTLKKAPGANPFGEGIARSVRAFYGTLNNELDSRIDGQFGVMVMSACEAIIREAEFKSAQNAGQIWTVLPPLQQPKVLVLGGTGFIGKYLIKALTQLGYGVRVVTRNRASGEIALAGLPLELVQGSLGDSAFLDEVMEGIEVIYDLAKVAGNKWEDYYTQDVLVTKKIAEHALAHGVKRFIYTGTIDSYYSGNQREVINSDTPLDRKIRIRNHYARSKAACESLLMELHNGKGLPVVIFRPGVVIGKGCPPAHWGIGMFQSETRVQFWGDGENKLPLVLVEDVASALVLGLAKEGIEGQTFLLTDTPMLSAREYVEIVSRESGTRVRAQTRPIWKFFLADALKEATKHLIRHANRKIPSYRDWDSRSHRARYDSSKTREVLGWVPAGTTNAMKGGIIEAIRDFTR